MKGLKMKAKRILAFALCLCMAMSILPMGASATGAEEVNIDFAQIDPSTCLVSQSGGYVSAKMQPVTSHYPETGLSVYWGIDAYEGRWLAYNLGSLKAGTYEGTLSGLPSNTGSEFSFWIVPAGDVAAITAALETTEPAATIDSYDSAVVYYNSYVATPKNASVNVTLENDGEYMLVAKHTGSADDYHNAGVGGEGIYFFNLKSLTLGVKEEVVYTDNINIAFKDTATADYTVSRSGYCSMTPLSYAPDKCAEIQSYAEDWMAYDLGGLKAGYYNGEVTCYKWRGGSSYNFYIIPKSDEVATITAALATAEPVATADGYVEGDYWTTVDADDTTASSINFTLDEDGEYMLVLRYESGDHPVKAGVGGTWVYGIMLGDFNAAIFDGQADTAAADVLGDNYAYIRKNGDAWAVNFFGGVKETEGYTAVGFEVSYTASNGAKVVLNKESNNVYASFNVGGDNIAATEFGTGAEYIFGEVFEVDTIDTSKPVIFKSYAVDTDENTIYGKTYFAVIE